MRTLLLLLIPGISVSMLAFARPPATGQPRSQKATGIDSRELWTTSKVEGFAGAAGSVPHGTGLSEIEVQRSVGKSPRCRAESPGASRNAKRVQDLYFRRCREANPEKKLVLDVKHTIYGLAFHPKFADNGFIFVSGVPDGSKETPDGSRVVRYIPSIFKP